VLAVAEAMREGGDAPEILEKSGEIRARGYLTPSEDEVLWACYAVFLARRAALLQVLASMESRAGHRGGSWAREPGAFVVALTAASLLIRGMREWIRLADACRPVRKALDQGDARAGVPRKAFAESYRATTSWWRLRRYEQACRHFREHREAFGPHPGQPKEWAALLDRLDRELDSGACRASLRERWRYRWFSFRRRHHSAWKRSEFGVFRWSGSLIAELRQPGMKPPGASKRVDAGLRGKALAATMPGDVFITRHDDALSNLFLPGFWPHAALFVRGVDGDFLEARKDGVKWRAAEDTLAVDAFVILRPPLGKGEIDAALARAASHAGKPYDFSFDFRRSDRLACTEVVYRAFHGIGGLDFALVETGGRLCLPAEELIRQALEQGFEVVGSAGIGKGGWLTGRVAELALHATRCGL
jgi:hypothetical protein